MKTHQILLIASLACITTVLANGSDYFLNGGTIFPDGRHFDLIVKRADIFIPKWNPSAEKLPLEPKEAVKKALSSAKILLNDKNIKFRSLILRNTIYPFEYYYEITVSNSKGGTLDIPVLLDGKVILPKLTNERG